MNLFENEQRITQSDNNQIILTNKRLRYQYNNAKNPDFTSIMLDKISAISVSYHQASVWMLILGIVLIPLLIGFIIIWLYFKSKTHVVTITSDGSASIVFATKGMKREFLDDFIDKVEKASLELKKL